MRLHRYESTLAALVIGTSWLAVRAEASDIVFSSFGPGYSYDIDHGITFGTYPNGGTTEYAVSFQVRKPGFTLDSITLAASRISGPNLLDVSLMSDRNGLPDKVIQTFHFVNSMGPFGELNPTLTAESEFLRPLLGISGQYWLAISPTSPTFGVWNANPANEGLQSMGARRDNGGAWISVFGPTPAFEIRGTEVPEPSTLTMGVIALAGAFILTRR